MSDDIERKDAVIADLAMRVIERGAEIERLRAAHQKIANLAGADAFEPLDEAIAIARRAL